MNYYTRIARKISELQDAAKAEIYEMMSPSIIEGCRLNAAEFDVALSEKLDEAAYIVAAHAQKHARQIAQNLYDVELTNGINAAHARQSDDDDFDLIYLEELRRERERRSS